MTALYLPGQTLYHCALLVEGHGKKALFAGDSGAPTGIDDYTAGNRTLLGKGKGFRRCIELWREHRPDYIINNHQDRGFVFSDDQLDYMERVLEERETLVAGLTPWEHASFAIDEWWARTYPYEQEATPGATVAIQVEFTNHGHQEAEVVVEPVLPDGWRWEKRRNPNRIRIAANTDGTACGFEVNPDGAARLWITVSADAGPGRQVIPVRITWNRRYLGQFRHAIINVR